MANGHQGREQLADEKDKAHGLVEIIEPNDKAYFKAQLLDINLESREYFVRYENTALTYCMPFTLFMLAIWRQRKPKHDFLICRYSSDLRTKTFLRLILLFTTGMMARTKDSGLIQLVLGCSHPLEVRR
jgi:hypothetical protein